jgi:hypothetical protein
MFGRFRKTSAPAQPLDEAISDPSKLPYTRALLRTAEVVRETIRNEAGETGWDLGEEHPDGTDLDGLTAGAIRLVTGYITSQILERLQRLDFFSGSRAQQLPNDAPALMAYSALLTLALYTSVKSEGCALPLKVVMQGLGEAIFPGWPNNQVKQARKNGFKIYNLLLNDNRPAAKELVGDFSLLVTSYVKQHGTDTPMKEPLDSIHFLSRLFESLASAVVIKT